MKALVLSGGGSRGAYQAGAWAALHETGWRPDLIVGTSAGALNGAMVAAGTPDEMRAWWTRLRQKDLLRWRKDVWRLPSWRGLHDQSPLRRLLERELDLDRVRASDYDVRVTAVDLEQGVEVVWRKEELTVAHLLAATALVPGVTPVEVDGRLHADGGHWSAVGLTHAVEAGATEVHAILHDPIAAHAEGRPDGFKGLLRRVSDLTWHGVQQFQMQALEARMRLPKRDPLHLQRCDITVHAPQPPLGNPVLEFDPVLADVLWQRGYGETRARLADAT